MLFVGVLDSLAEESRIVIGVEQEKMVAQEIACLPNTAARVPFQGSTTVLNFQPEIFSIAEVILDDVAEVTDQQHDFLIAVFFQLLEQVSKKWLAANRRHGLGQSVGDLTQTRATTAAKDDCLAGQHDEV